MKLSVYSLPSTSSSTSIPNPTLLATATLNALTSPPPTLSYQRGTRTIDSEPHPSIESQEDAFNTLLDTLVQDEGLEEIREKEHVTHVCHRVVHGGDYPGPRIIDKDVFGHLTELTELAPL